MLLIIFDHMTSGWFAGNILSEMKNSLLPTIKYNSTCRQPWQNEWFTRSMVLCEL